MIHFLMKADLPVAHRRLDILLKNISMNKVVIFDQMCLNYARFVRNLLGRKTNGKFSFFP